MPIISAEVLESRSYRISLTLGHGMTENIIITTNGLYSVFYIKDGKSFNEQGKAVNVVQNKTMPNNSYILFDFSLDNCNRRERVYFYQIQYLKDITPNNAYQIAVDNGFIGTVEDWLTSLKGDPGKSAYEIAVDCGFEGSEEEWLNSLRGEQGYSAYDIAIKLGFEGSEQEWLASLKGEKGDTGYSAYEIAVEHGFKGSEEEWLASLGDGGAMQTVVKDLVNNVDILEEASIWKDSMDD